MKLATLKDGNRDGRLVVVSRDLNRYQSAAGIAPTLQFALDQWDQVEPKLQEIYSDLNISTNNSSSFVPTACRAPLPRAYEWIDGSAYIHHIKLVRKARGAELPKTLLDDPLVYQGGSGVLLGPTDDITCFDLDWGCDFESEVCVILGDTPQRVQAADAAKYIRLIMLCNDVSLRNLIPSELEKGFGFFNSKPASAFSPVCITPDELGEHWHQGRVHLPLKTFLNGEFYGDPNAGPEMHFSFFNLIEHITKTRAFTAGTILGSGTVSNVDKARGSSCLAEKRMIEKIETGSIKTSFLNYGDRIKIEMHLPNGQNIFGSIDQVVTNP